MDFRFLLCVCLFFVANFVLCLGSLGNPYKILGIEKKASITDIKKAYKQLAKEW